MYNSWVIVLQQMQMSNISFTAGSCNHAASGDMSIQAVSWCSWLHQSWKHLGVAQHYITAQLRLQNPKPVHSQVAVVEKSYIAYTPVGVLCCCSYCYPAEFLVGAKNAATLTSEQCFRAAA